MFYQKNIFSFVLAAVFLVLAVEASASLEDFARVPTFGTAQGEAEAGGGQRRCMNMLISDFKLITDEQLPIGDLTEFVRNDGLSSWFLFLRQAELANSKLSADHIYKESELSQKTKHYSTQVDLFLDSPDVTIDRKLQVLLYNLAFVTQLVRNGSDEVADLLRTQPAISDFMVRQIQWLQHPAFIDMISFAYSQFENMKAMGGAGPVAIPPPGHEPAMPDGSLVIPHFGTLKFTSMRASTNEPIEVTVEPDFVSLGALEILFENLLSPRQGAKIVAETAVLIYTIYSRSPLPAQNSQLKQKFIFRDTMENRSQLLANESRLPLRRLIEETLRPSLLDFRTHPLITLFFLQLDLRLFETVQKSGRQLTLKNGNVFKMVSPVFTRALDFFFGDLLADGAPAAPMAVQDVAQGRLARRAEDDPQIALYMGDASGYTYDQMRDKEFLRRYFMRLERILDSKGLKSAIEKSANSDWRFFHSEPALFAIHALPSGNSQPPSSKNPLIYNLPSSVARTMIFSLLDWFLQSDNRLASVFLREILSFKIGPTFVIDDQDGKPSTPDAGGSFANQAQFLRKTLGIPDDLPTSASLHTASALQTQIFEPERNADQRDLHQVVKKPDLTSSHAVGKPGGLTGVFNRGLDSFYSWKLGFQDSPVIRTTQPQIDTQIKPVARGPRPYFNGPNSIRLVPEFDRARAVQLLNDISNTSPPAMAPTQDKNFHLVFAKTLLVQHLLAEIKKIDSDVKGIYRWATNKDNGLVHWMDYVSQSWSQKAQVVDREDLRFVIERLSYDLGLYLEVQNSCERHPNFPHVLPPSLGDQLNRSIERSQEIRGLLFAIFYRLIAGISDDPKERNIFHDIRTRMIQIGLTFPDEE